MEHDAGRSTTSGSAAAALSLSISSCTISFQGFRSYQLLHAAIAKHALKTTGIAIKFSLMVNVLARHDILSKLPRALAPTSYSLPCLGFLADFIRSPSDVEIYASLFCHNDYDLAASQIAADLLAPVLRSARPSPSEFAPSLLATTSPSRGASVSSEIGTLFSGDCLSVIMMLLPLSPPGGSRLRIQPACCARALWRAHTCLI